MRDQHGEELESGDELMVSAERGVIVAAVEDASVRAVLKTREGDCFTERPRSPPNGTHAYFWRKLDIV